MPKKVIVIIVVILILVIVPFFFSGNDQPQQDDPAPPGTEEEIIYNFYLPSCPYCREEHAFLDALEEQYPEITVRKYNLTNKANLKILEPFYEKYGVAEADRGRVPATFFGDQHFIGYSEETVGAALTEHAKKVRQIVQSQQQATKETENAQKKMIPES